MEEKTIPLLEAELYADALKRLPFCLSTEDIEMSKILIKILELLKKGEQWQTKSSKEVLKILRP